MFGFGKKSDKLPDDAPAVAREAGVPGETGGATPGNSRMPAYAIPFHVPLQGLDVGPVPNKGNGYHMVFIPPLALFNDATQWVNKRFFVRPMPFNMTPGSLPRMAAQYSIGPRPGRVTGLSAGLRNAQAQLGNVAIQATRLDEDASNYFGQ